MLTGNALKSYLAREFTPAQAALLYEVLNSLSADLVRAGDFNELKEIVRDLAEAQRRTEQRVEQLADAQQRTEEEVRILARGLNATRSEVAGLSRQFGYALENEAYRALPALLRERYGMEVTRRFVRTYVGDQEVNLLAEGSVDGEAVLIVGEVKAHLGTDDFDQLETSLEAVRLAQTAGQMPNYRIVPVLVTHMARPAALRRAEEEGIIVVQTFEW